MLRPHSSNQDNAARYATAFHGRHSLRRYVSTCLAHRGYALCWLPSYGETGYSKETSSPTAFTFFLKENLFNKMAATEPGQAYEIRAKTAYLSKLLKGLTGT
ncbi:unnamed protein product [Ixodes pacificus]